MSVAKHKQYHESEAFADRVEIMEPVAIACGVISLIASLAVCTTGFLFPKMVKNKIYMQMIMMVSMFEVFSALAASLGFPKSVDACAAQGGMLFFFYRCGWTWAIFIIIQLNMIVKDGKSKLSFLAMNVICFTINIVLEFLPLATGTVYGVADSLRGKTFCSFNVYGDDFFFWVCMCFVGPLLLTIMTLMILSVVLYSRIRHIHSAYNTNMVKMVVLYPAAMMLAWLPLAIFYFAHFGKKPGEHHSEQKFIDIYTCFSIIYSWTSLDGFFVAVVFFVNSAEARKRWTSFMKKKCQVIFGVDTSATDLLEEDETSNSNYTNKNSSSQSNSNDFGRSGTSSNGNDRGRSSSAITCYDGGESDFQTDDEMEQRIRDEEKEYSGRSMESSDGNDL